MSSYFLFYITKYDRFSINILTKYENNNGSTENCLEASGETLEARKVLFSLQIVALFSVTFNVTKTCTLIEECVIEQG